MTRLPDMTLRTKVLVPVIACMALLIVLAMLVVNRRVNQQFRTEAWNTLASADAEFRNYQRNRCEDLLLRFRNLPREPRYRATFLLGDPATLRQPLEDLLSEQNLDIVFYSAEKGVTAVAKRDAQMPATDFESAAKPCVSRALEGQETVDTLKAGNRLYSLVSVPVSVDGEVIGALSFGLEIGESEARRLSRLAHSQVVFLAGSLVAASTLTAPDVNEKCLSVLDTCLLPAKGSAPTANLTQIVVDGRHYFGLSGRFDSLAGDTTLNYVLLSSYEDALQALGQTQVLLLEVSACAILLGSWVVWWLVKRATQPLQELRAGVEAVARGDFSKRLEIKSKDECGQLATVYNTMAENLKRSKEELEKASAELARSSRLAGMAEVATGVLHNVRNVMTSVNIASALVADRINKSRTPGLAKVVALLREHENDLATFLTIDAKGKKVIEYLAQLSDHFAGDQAAIVKELKRMQDCIEHMQDVVKSQQEYAKTSGAAEKLALADLVEDALKMNTSSRSNVQVVKQFADGLTVHVQKHKVLQVLVNLIRNGREACEGSPSAVKTLTVRTTNGDQRVRIAVTDNGVGIAPEHLNRIFSHGFTTKKDGHGFGLHHSALVAKELGGALLVHSEGEGKGATFTLELPAAQ
ncbi:MAG TPA: ATP-binding protein [Verrucomicrobiae bacterium]|nr:ATP-binding protein [Verrucomicrobiae bacterium]